MEVAGEEHTKGKASNNNHVKDGLRLMHPMKNTSQPAQCCLHKAFKQLYPCKQQGTLKAH